MRHNRESQLWRVFLRKKQLLFADYDGSGGCLVVGDDTTKISACWDLAQIELYFLVACGYTFHIVRMYGFALSIDDTNGERIGSFWQLHGKRGLVLGGIGEGLHVERIGELLGIAAFFGAWLLGHRVACAVPEYKIDKTMCVAHGAVRMCGVVVWFRAFCFTIVFWGVGILFVVQGFALCFPSVVYFFQFGVYGVERRFVFVYKGLHTFVEGFLLGVLGFYLAIELSLYGFGRCAAFVCFAHFLAQEAHFLAQSDLLGAFGFDEFEVGSR
jgi:hypothetical protein